MTQDDSAIIDRLKHESMVRWVRASGRDGWQPCDVRSEVMLNAARHIESMAKHIQQLKAALDMKTGVEMECSEYWKQTQIQASEIRKLRDELRTYTDGTNDDVQREAV